MNIVIEPLANIFNAIVIFHFIRFYSFKVMFFVFWNWLILIVREGETVIEAEVKLFKFGSCRFLGWIDREVLCIRSREGNRILRGRFFWDFNRLNCFSDYRAEDGLLIDSCIFVFLCLVGEIRFHVLMLAADLIILMMG